MFAAVRRRREVGQQAGQLAGGQRHRAARLGFDCNG